MSCSLFVMLGTILIHQLKSEINRIADSANFNGIKLLDGSMSANGTTTIKSAASTQVAGVDVNIVADSVFDANGSRSELKFSFSVVSKASDMGAKVDKNGNVTISVARATAGQASYSAADIQALLSKVTAQGADVSADMVNAAKNATVTGAGIQDATGAGAGKWTALKKSNGGNAVANAGKPLTLQIGDTSDSFNQLKVGIKDCHVAALGLTDMKIGDQDSAAKALDKIKSAINYVSDVRGTLGATQNRLDHTINNLSVMQENIQDAESTIRDTDVADEMMAYTKNNILIQSAQAMLAQANQVPQGVLQLLQ